MMSHGVVTNADQSTEWRMPWWWHHYSQHCDLPVAFADFGMSRKMKRWCKKHGEVYDVTDNIRLKNWFKKPSAIRRAPFEEVLMLDNDCEVRKPIDNLFGYVSIAHVGLTYDVKTQFNTKWCNPPVQSGVVVAHRDNELIEEWESYCLRANKIRDDQVTLCWLLKQRESRKVNITKINIMPPEAQWLRLQGNFTNPKIQIMHWTGPAGDDIIRQQMTRLNIKGV
jgi:hypothetical protein